MPKSSYGRSLSRLFRMVTGIKTREERDRFLALWASWEERYGEAIDSRRERGPVFSDIKRARSVLLKALPSMFDYLEDPAIPPTTNALEGYFSRMKDHYREHRGLSVRKRDGYFSWYFYYHPK